jgi:GMP synthase (glutamine-hydrolysing)
MLMSIPQTIHCFMHVSFEGPGVIADWARQNGHDIHYTRFYENDALPEPRGIDLLVIMGGPMNVFESHIHPWMEDEVQWVGEFVASGGSVLGICLGAQIIAAALGAEVYPGPHKEIGWFSLRCLPCLGDYRICKGLPSVRKVFHWHGDTFDIPKGAVRMAESRAFSNQGFIYDGRVMALQFHLEVTGEDVKGMIENCGDELGEGPFMQSAGEILAEKGHFEGNHQLMFHFLDYLTS